MECEISPQDLHVRLQQHPAHEIASNFVLVDVREPWEAQMAVISGSRSIPLGDLPTRANEELNPEAHIVLYCHRGMRSLNAALWLREQGYSRAQSLSGGIDAWAETIDPSLARY